MMTPTGDMEALALLNGPRDTVTIRNAGGDWVAMVGYDIDGEVQIEVRIRRGRVSPRWESWMLRWLRGWAAKGRLTLMR